MNDTFESRLIKWVVRRPLEIVLAIYTFVLLWAGLVPFHFSGQAAHAVDGWNWLGVGAQPVHLPDVAANVVAFIPVGLIVRALLVRSRWTPVGSLIGAVLIGAAVSLTIETAQVYSPLRYSSVADFVCNTSGAAVGAAVHSLVALVFGTGARLGGSWLDEWIERLQHRPSAIAAQVWAGIIAFASLAPFDVAISVNRLVASVRDTTLIPFTRTARLGKSVWLTELEPGAAWKGASTDLWQLGLDYAWTVFAYGLLAILICRYLRTHCRVRGFRQAATAFAACVVLAGAVSVGQLFVMSRSADSTAVLIALAGALLGVFASGAALRAWSPDVTSGGPSAPRARRRLVHGALVLFIGYVAVRQLAPFEFHTSVTSIEQQVHSIEWIPFRMYQHTRMPIAVDDAVHKLMQWAGIALLICLCRRHRGTLDQRHSVVDTACATAACACAIEAVQLLLPTRNPAVTDVVVTAFAAGTGVVLYRLTTGALITLGLLRPVEVDTAQATGGILYNVELGAPAQGPPEIVPEPAPADEMTT